MSSSAKRDDRALHNVISQAMGTAKVADSDGDPSFYVHEINIPQQ